MGISLYRLVCGCPLLILPAGRFAVMYYDPDAQGQYASHFPTGGQGFMQPRGDIRTSIVPRNFCVLPADVREVVDQYFHREELERRVDLDEEESMSTDTEATETVRQLQLDSPAAMALLQVAVHKVLMPATAPDHRRRRNTTTTQMTRSSILMNNIPNWQRGSSSGRPPDGMPPLYHRGVSLTLARNSDYSVTSCLTCARP